MKNELPSEQSGDDEKHFLPGIVQTVEEDGTAWIHFPHSVIPEQTHKLITDDEWEQELLLSQSPGYRGQILHLKLL